MEKISNEDTKIILIMISAVLSACALIFLICFLLKYWGLL